METLSPSIKRSNCYMVWGGEFSNSQQTRVSQEDFIIGCLVDLDTGLMTFTANGKEINTFYQVSYILIVTLFLINRRYVPQLWDVVFSQVEPNTKLFPAVFVLPSSQNMIQFELGKLKVCSKLVKQRNLFQSFLPNASFLWVCLSP